MKNRVRELREAQKISGPKLAEMLNISPQYLYDLEKGERRLNEELIARLTRIFNVTADYLLGYTNDPTPPKREPILNEPIPRQERYSPKW